MSDSSEQGIFFLCADGTIRHCNQILLRWIGATHAQCYAQPITNFLSDFLVDMDASGFGATLVATIPEPKLLQSQLGGTLRVQVTTRAMLLDGMPFFVVLVERVGETYVAEQYRDSDSASIEYSINRMNFI